MQKLLYNPDLDPLQKALSSLEKAKQHFGCVRNKRARTFQKKVERIVVEAREFRSSSQMN